MQRQEWLGHQKGEVAEKGLDRMLAVARREPTAWTPWETGRKRVQSSRGEIFKTRGMENKTPLHGTGPSAKGTRRVLFPVFQNKK